MVAAQRADADHADRQAARHAGTPRSDDSTNVEEALDLGQRRQVAPRPLEGLREIEVGVEEEPVGALERGDGLAREAGALQADRVEAVQLHRVADRLHVGRDVLVDPGAAADEGVGADGDELVDGVEAAEHGAVVDGDVARALGAVGDDDVVADVAVVGQVHVGHDEAAGAHHGAVASPRCRG